MIATLFRQDPALGTLKVTVPLALMGGVLLGLVYNELPIEFGSAPPSALHPGALVLFICLICLFLFFMVTAGFWTRCRRLDMSLPIPVRKLWIVRTLSVFYGWLLPLALLILPFALGEIYSGGGWKLDRGILAQGGQVAALLFLVMMLLQIPSRRLQKIRLSASYVLYASAISLTCVLISVLCKPSLFLALPVITVAMLLFGWSYFKTPVNYVVAPAMPEPAPRTVASVIPDDGTDALEGDGVAASPEVTGEGSYSWFLFKTVARSLLNWPPAWIIMLISTLYGFSVTEFYRNGRSQLVYTCFLIIWFAAQLAWFCTRLNRLDHLPIRRRVLLPFSVLTYLLMFFMGVALSEVIHRVAPRNRSLVCYYNCQIHVPPEFWEIASDGEPPLVTAPWGESHRPEDFRLFRHVGPAVYLPFEHGPDNSNEFIAWQIDRAVARVHAGAEPVGDLDVYRERGAQISGDIDELGRCGFSLDGEKGRVSPLHRRTLAMGTLLTVILAVPLTTITLRTLRPGRVQLLSRIFLPFVASLFGLLLVGMLLAWRWGYSNTQFMDNYVLVWVRRMAEALPVGTPVLWLLVVAAVLLGYLLIQRSFMRIEVPLKKKHFLAEYDA